MSENNAGNEQQATGQGPDAIKAVLDATAKTLESHGFSFVGTAARHEGEGKFHCVQCVHGDPDAMLLGAGAIYGKLRGESVADADAIDRLVRYADSLAAGGDDEEFDDDGGEDNIDIGVLVKQALDSMCCRGGECGEKKAD